MRKPSSENSRLAQLLAEHERLTDQINEEIKRLANAGPTVASAERPITVAALAKRWGCSRDTVYDMLQDGRLKGFKLGGKLWRIPGAEVARYESGGETSTQTVSPPSHVRPPAMSMAELRLLCRQVRGAN